jgi:predicted nuclease of predicted toxin-antitoxin system
MRFLLDQDVYTATHRFLQAAGHEVTTAAEAGLSRARDAELLRQAHETGSLLVTRDRDYGRLVFLEESLEGVVYLRILPATLRAVHRQLEILLSRHVEAELRSAFVVVEADRYRIRRLQR